MEEHVGKKVKLKRPITDADYHTKCGSIEGCYQPKIGKTYTVKSYTVNFDAYTFEEEECNGYYHPAHVFELVTELTSLPPHWFVRTNSSINKVLCDWRGSGHSGTSPTYGGESVLTSDKCWSYIKMVPPEYKEITFDQFKKWVLKEPIVEPVKSSNSRVIQGVELIDGQVYWCNSNTFREGFIFKYKHTSSLHILDAYCKLRLDEKELKTTNCGTNNSHWNNLRLAIFSERQWLEACIKANKYLSKEEALNSSTPKTEEFKVGNWCVILSAIDQSGDKVEKACNSVSSYIPLIGKCFQVSAIEKSSYHPWVWLRFKDVDALGISSTQVRKALPHEISTNKSTPKVGDWAKIVTLDSKSKGSMDGEIGHVFQIESISNGFYRATEATRIEGNSWPLDCIELVYPSEVTKTIPKESLLEEAKRRYPIGTKFIGIYNQVSLGKKEVCEVVNANPYLSGSDILVSANRPSEKAVNASTFIYYKGQWAEIVEETQSHPEYVECLGNAANQFTKGKIYKFKKEGSNGFWLVEKDDKGSTTNGMSKCLFKPSTREAYEKQESKPVFDTKTLEAQLARIDDLKIRRPNPNPFIVDYFNQLKDYSFKKELLDVSEISRKYEQYTPQSKSGILPEEKPLLVKQEREQETKILLLN